MEHGNWPQGLTLQNEHVLGAVCEMGIFMGIFQKEPRLLYSTFFFYRVATKFRYGSYLAKNGSKNGGIKANTTSSSSKFCQLSKNARLFDLGPAAGTEIRVFVSQGGVQNQ